MDFDVNLISVGCETHVELCVVNLDVWMLNGFVDIKAGLSRAFTCNLDKHPALVGDEEHGACR